MEGRNFYKLLRRLRGIELAGRRAITGRSLLIYGDEVAAARQNKLPIVALESTIITHGMPYPNNLQTAIRVENVVRERGAVPATIAILNGRIHVGLSHDQLEVLSRADPRKTTKCSRRDISPIVSQKLNGGTTVSATMLIANLARIPIMATGGIGGVHRGAELTFDVSTDLMELGRTPVAVVCSGVKSILDIPKTLEFLETQGVPVVKIGETNDFPAFYCTETFDRVKASHRVSNSKEAAELLRVQEKLGIETGILFAVPIPEKYALDAKATEAAIHEALEAAKSKSITGKNVTPFLLEELNKITRGQSLQANMALIENNAEKAADIAINFADHRTTSFSVDGTREFLLRTEKSPVILGGAVMDTTLQLMEAERKEDGRTHAGRSRESCGGVGRNIANALITLGLNGTRLISVVGNDQPGKAIIKSLGDGAQTVERLPNTNTARYTAIVDAKGECCFGIGEMDAFSSISPDLVKRHRSLLEEASIIVLDGNIPLNTIQYVVDLASHSKVPVWYEPTDVKKATKIFEASAQWQDVLHFISPNKNELLAIASHFGIAVPETRETMSLEEIEIVARNLAERIPVVVSTLGSKGVMIVRKASERDPFYGTDGRLITKGSIKSRLYPPLTQASRNPAETCNVSGCGDCLTAGIIYGIQKNLDETNCLTLALKAAALSLTSFHAVPSSLSTLRDDFEA